MYHVDYNVPDSIHNKFIQFFSPADYEKAITQAMRNYLENIEDEKDCKTALKRKKTMGKLYSIDDVFGN